MEAETGETTTSPSAIPVVLQATWLLPGDLDSELTLRNSSFQARDSDPRLDQEDQAGLPSRGHMTSMETGYTHTTTTKGEASVLKS